MSSHPSRLEAREEIARDTMAFHLRKPPGFVFRPGQAIDLILAGPPAADPQGTRHTFSIASAPFEEHLVIATRMRDSAFKRALKALPAGSPLSLEGPFGSLTLDDDHERPAVLIAGGIGITPFVSILRQAANDRLKQALLLLYASRRPEDAAFLAELQQLAQRNENVRLLATMTRMDSSAQPWNGDTGPIDEARLKRIGRDLVAPIYYLAGSPGMVEALRDSLNGVGVDDDDIRSEGFYGY